MIALETMTNGAKDGANSAELKQRLDRICQDFIESRADIEEGAVEVAAALEEAHKERLWSAACWRDYQLSVAEKTFASETAQIETEFAAEALQLRDSMLTALTEQRQALQEERERLIAMQQSTAAASDQVETANEQNTGSANTGRVKRSMRSAAAGAKRDEIILKATLGAGGSAVPPLPNAAPKRRAAAPYGSSILGVSTLLPEYEIYDDLNAISRGCGSDDGGAGRRNAPRTQAQKASDRPSTNTTKRRTVAAEDEPVAISSPLKPTLKRSMKDLSAPADESLSADDQNGAEDEETTSTKTSRSARRKSLSISVGEEPSSQISTDGTLHKRKNSAEDKYISIEPSGVFYYCGCKYAKGASFDMAFGRDLSKSFPVTLLSAAGQEIQVKKVADGSKIKISLDDLVSGSVMILASQ